jgi:hypothetical protein
MIGCFTIQANIDKKFWTFSVRIPENPLRTIFPYPVKSSERMPEKEAAMPKMAQTFVILTLTKKGKTL